MKRAKLPKRKQLKRYSWDVSLWKLLWKWNSRQEHTAFWTKCISTFQLYSFYFYGPLHRILFVCDYLKCPFSKSAVLRRALKYSHKNNCFPNSLPSISDYCSSGTYRYVTVRACWAAGSFEMGQSGWPATTVTNCQSVPSQMPEECRSRLHCGGILKLHTNYELM